ncbi:MAG: thioredoxin family protein [Proteobacteria bacterium]|nr:thioredoxin family protein [Pseudomonadota bacterium]
MLTGPAQATGPVNTGHDVVELAPAGTATPGHAVYVALSQHIAPDWHTYWRNAGDSGEPPQIAWSLPKGWTAGSIIWPVPSKLPVGPLMNYGYEGSVLLPVALTPPAIAMPGSIAEIRAHVSLLVCSDICIPEQADLSLRLPVTARPHADAKWGSEVSKTVAHAPKTAALTAVMNRENGILKIAVTGPAVRSGDFSHAYFFPSQTGLIDHARPQILERGSKGLTLAIAPGLAFSAAHYPRSISGVLSLGTQSYEIVAHEGPLPRDARGSSGARDGNNLDTALSLGLLSAIAFAFLGGLILNLMPCVLPILSLKVLSFAGPKRGAQQIRVQSLSYLAGVLATFLALASLLLAAKAAGAEVGWGFQMQSPVVVAGLALLMLLVGLNLVGTFEAGLLFQRAGANVAAHSGATSAFLTGVLAVVVAAPCTAPFMASAVAYALVQNPLTIATIFTALGFGFAAPYVVFAFAPKLASRLPRPGVWMVTMKTALAFPMFATAGWLAWVLTLQAGTSALASLLGAGVILAFAAWSFGEAQRRSGRGARAFQIASLAALIATVILTMMGLRGAETDAFNPRDATVAAGLPQVPFSPQRLAELRARGKPVFVDFTAAWCITCQVNERIVLSRPTIARAFARAGAVYMVADWTRRDATIAHALAEQGRAGVPLYLVYGANGDRPVVLPQLLTEEIVSIAIRRATRA